ncbi:MAG TPA: hypothetical protein ACFYEF_09920 [Candidatus Wunengus sp. YC63]|uniref:hypothetical protein n=1 Tax=Candidatus Wunengus sp. YC63 TaxID=3367699 RepID=UPI002713F48B|nr:hypothetical protein [Candidatus Brocadiales bacterium]
MKMHFIRNMEALNNADVKSHVTEYEVIADAHIVGEFSYGPYHFTIWEFSNKQAGETRKLCLRIREKAFSADDELWESAKRTGFYHGGGIADELVALASLFLRRRFQIGSIVRWDDKPQLVSIEKWIDRPIVDGQSNLGEIPSFLKLVEGLDSKYHQKFILSVRLYHRALLLIEEQPDLAYLNLVSAIETLCQDHPIEKVTLIDLDSDLSQLIEAIEDRELRSKIERSILKRERFIGRRFIVFILDHIENDFWIKDKRPEHGQIKPEQLPDLLKRIYNQRSRTLHLGEPFPPSIFQSPSVGAEIDFFLSMSVGGKKWEQKDFIPHVHFFEKLVNNVLKVFLQKNQDRK